ncbi:MAG: hypothetical protein IPF99_32825 [Deltaproteobacteria bacterium]|nr:hypothetical protein [Deltaproteobacteria bacterium]
MKKTTDGSKLSRKRRQLDRLAARTVGEAVAPLRVARHHAHERAVRVPGEVLDEVAGVHLHPADERREAIGEQQDGNLIGREGHRGAHLARRWSWVETARPRSI